MLETEKVLMKDCADITTENIDSLRVTALGK
jgi:hypothetical protein